MSSRDAWHDKDGNRGRGRGRERDKERERSYHDRDPERPKVGDGIGERRGDGYWRHSRRDEGRDRDSYRGRDDRDGRYRGGMRGKRSRSPVAPPSRRDRDRDRNRDRDGRDRDHDHQQPLSRGYAKARDLDGRDERDRRHLDGVPPPRSDKERGRGGERERDKDRSRLVDRDRDSVDASHGSQYGQEEGEAVDGKVPMDTDPTLAGGEAIAGMDEEEVAMMSMMGFGGFGSTKGKQVEGNETGTADVKKQRTWRQYMNRRGGFNRPLDKI